MNHALTTFTPLPSQTLGTQEDNLPTVRDNKDLLEREISNPEIRFDNAHPDITQEDTNKTDFTEALSQLMNVDTPDNIAIINSGLISQPLTSKSAEQVFAVRPNAQNKIELNAKPSLEPIISPDTHQKTTANKIAEPTLEPIISPDTLLKTTVNQNVPDQAAPPPSPVTHENTAILATPQLIANKPDVDFRNAEKIPLATVPMTGKLSPFTNIPSKPQLKIAQAKINIPAANTTNSANNAAPILRTDILKDNTHSKPDGTSSRETITAQLVPLASADKSTLLQIAPQHSPSQGNAIISQLGETLTQQASEITSKLHSKSSNLPKPILVQLSPAELGRVEIQFSFDGHQKITAHIIAESSETGHLLKRKSEMLVTHLRLGGFENIDLNFDTKAEKNFSDFISNGSKNNTATFSHSGQGTDNPSGSTLFDDVTDPQPRTRSSKNIQAVTEIPRPMSNQQSGQLDITV